MLRRYHLLAALTAPLLFGASLGAQSMDLGETRQLPMLGVSGDHAIVAVNNRGDLFVAWQSSPTNGASMRQVEGVFLRKSAGNSWLFPTTQEVLLLGDPSLNVMGSDTCPKPFVIGLDEDFIVGWLRVDRNTQTTRVEMVKIVAPASGPVTVDSPAPGRGYVVSGDYDSGNSGKTLAMCRRQYDPFAPGAPMEEAVYFVTVKSIADSGDLHDYRLRGWTADFSIGSGAPMIRGPFTLVDTVWVDSSTNFGRGRIPPTIQENDDGDLILAYEEFHDPSRSAGMTSHEGRIRVQRFYPSIFGLQGDAELVFEGNHLERHQRRPNLDTSPNDDNDVLTLSWVELDHDGANGIVHQKAIWFNALGGHSRDVPYPNPVIPTASGARSIHGTEFYASLAAFDSTPAQLWGYQALPPANLYSWNFPGTAPERPFADLHDAGLGVGQRELPMVYDRDVGSGQLKIFLVIYKV